MKPSAYYLSIIIIALMASLSGCTVMKFGSRFPTDKKMVLLTFDDGPNGDKNVTNDLLAVLRKHNVKAVFNVIGRNVSKYPDIVNQTYSDGHIIANHSNTGYPLLFRSRNYVRRNFDSCQCAIQSAINNPAFTTKYYRPPLGWFGLAENAVIHERELIKIGLTNYQLDAQKSSRDTHAIIAEIVRTAIKHKGSIFVLHDGVNEYPHINKRVKQRWKSYDRRFIPIITDSTITQLKTIGFSFPRLDEAPKNDLTADELDCFRKIIN